MAIFDPKNEQQRDLDATRDYHERLLGVGHNNLNTTPEMRWAAESRIRLEGQSIENLYNAVNSSTIPNVYDMSRVYVPNWDKNKAYVEDSKFTRTEMTSAVVQDAEVPAGVGQTDDIKRVPSTYIAPVTSGHTAHNPYLVDEAMRKVQEAFNTQGAQ